MKKHEKGDVDRRVNQYIRQLGVVNPAQADLSMELVGRYWLTLIVGIEGQYR